MYTVGFVHYLVCDCHGSGNENCPVPYFARLTPAGSYQGHRQFLKSNEIIGRIIAFINHNTGIYTCQYNTFPYLDTTEFVP